MQEGPHLGQTSPHTGLRFHQLLRVGAGRRWLPAELLLQTRPVGCQTVGSPLVTQLFAARHSPPLKGAQIAQQGRLADVANSFNKMVRQSQTLEINGLHLALHFRVRMGIAFLFQHLPGFRSKGKLHHGFSPSYRQVRRIDYTLP